VHWVALLVVLVTIAAALVLHGWLSGEVQGAGQVRPPGDAAQVPPGVVDGGPVLGLRGPVAGQGTGQGAGQGAGRSLPPRTVILSFDDGPDPTWTPQVLRVLRKHQVPGTFFLVGDQMLQHPDLVRQELAEGHEIGNHSFSHPDPTLHGAADLRSQLERAQLALVGITGRTTALYRPPYSFSADALDDRYWDVVVQARSQGYVTVLADVDTRDWARPGVDAIVRNAIPEDGRGAIVLLHDAGGERSQTVAALDRLIPQLKAQGYRFTTVQRAFGVDPYHRAAPADLWRGRALVWASQVSGWLTAAFWAAFLVAGALTLLRLALMLVVARRHHRRYGGGLGGADLAMVDRPVSVVVPAYNERVGIEGTLRSLLAGVHPVEVIVVDDGSTDGTADLVASLRLPGVTLLRQANAGKPAALNAGIARARHDLLVLVDGDTRFEPETVRRLVQPFVFPEVGAVSGNAKVGNRRRLIGRWQHIEYVMGFNLDRRLYDVLGCMSTVPGAVGAFRRQALEQVGGVSDDTLAEDTDLTVAVVRAGWRVVYREDARAWTEAPSSWGQLWRQRYRWCYGTLQAMWKHRRALVERGPSGRYGRRGLAFNLLFQVLLPLTAPAMDLYLIFGLLTGEAGRALLLWLVMLGMQLLGAVYAFRLDGERLAPLWALPLQQLAYRQLMYLVVVNSVFTALYGLRLPWVKLRRTGEVGMPGSASAPSAPSSSGGSRVGGPG
jgi:cellulose synthase/poly-beta-1,6-N-acetylglucosamine synthase-like glycosyltransferase/peptidoglycan/xylan/chitin deacetylase (PgdA/CDA1 family)